MGRLRSEMVKVGGSNAVEWLVSLAMTCSRVSHALREPEKLCKALDMPAFVAIRHSPVIVAMNGRRWMHVPFDRYHRYALARSLVFRYRPGLN